MNSGVLVIASRLLSVLIGFVTAPIVAHALGPAGRGESAAALACIALLPIVLGLGIPLVVRRHSLNLVGMAEAVRSVRVIALMTVIPAALIGVLINATVLRSFNAASSLAFIVACAGVPLAVLWICDANALIARGRILAFAIVNVLPAATNVALVATSAALGGLTVALVIYANLAATIATLTFTTLTLRVSLRGPRLPLRSLVREGASYSGSQIAEAASYRLDQIVALPIIGASQAGLYSVAATIGLIPYAVGQAVASVTFRQIGDSPTDELRSHRIAFSVRAGVLLSGITALTLAIMTPWVVPALFGNAFAGAVLPTLIALGGSIAVVACYVSASALTVVGRGWRMTLAQVVGLIVGIILLFVFSALGAVGASIASSVGFIVTAAISVRALPIALRQLRPGMKDLKNSVRLLFTGRID